MTKLVDDVRRSSREVASEPHSWRRETSCRRLSVDLPKSYDLPVPRSHISASDRAARVATVQTKSLSCL